MIEPKINEVFEYKGYILKCVEHGGCDGCFLKDHYLCEIPHPICHHASRIDKKSVIFIKMEKPEIKAGMLVETIAGITFLIVPTQSGDLVGISEGDNWHSTISNGHDAIKIGWPKNYYDAKKWTFGTVLWEKPKETVLTMQEIADKFGVPVEQLKIKK